MGPAERGLVVSYDEVRRKFFPNAKQAPKKTEADLLTKIHELQVAYLSVSNKLSTAEKHCESVDKRLAFMEKLFKPEFLDESNPPQKIITVHSILRVVCRNEKVSQTAIISFQRTKDIAHIRHIVCYLACNLTFCSLPQIGRVLGDRDHTTILYGRDKITRLRLSDSYLNHKLTRYEQQLLGQESVGATP